MQPIATGLTGSEIINRLRQGHVVRRPGWIKNFYTRICNEDGFDENGNAIFDEMSIGIYTLGTDGYFSHIGYSPQPFPPKYKKMGVGADLINIIHRKGDGLCALFAGDWEDYGFMTPEEFGDLTNICKPLLKAQKEEARNHVANPEEIDEEEE